MRILGVDPSLRCTGYGVVECNGAGLRLLEGGVIAPRVRAPFESRLAELARGLADVIEGFQPDAMIVEEVFSRSGYPKTALLMAHARGALVSTAARARLPVFNYAATTVKRALVGRGGASKEQVAAMVVQLLGLRRRPQPPDVTDALALAITHIHRLPNRAVVRPKVDDRATDRAVVRPKVDDRATDRAVVRPKVDDRATDRAVVRPKVDDRATDRAVVRPKVDDRATDRAVVRPKVDDRATEGRAR